MQNNNILFRSLENSRSKLPKLSKINFKECEEKIKKYYNINDTDSLIIYISEYFENGLLIAIIEYEIINIKEKKYVNLNICKGLTTDNEYLVSINDNNVFKHNSSSDYYNNLCYKYTTEKDTDIILKDRRNEFINYNMSLCEQNCEFKEYKINIKTVLCECQVKLKFN